MVNSDDVAFVQACKDAGVPLSDDCTRADFDADGDVDRRDMGWVRKHWCRGPIPNLPDCY
jgi:hypothetical protein